MKIVYALLISVCVVVFYNCTSLRIIQMDKVSWLSGTWENPTARGTIYETWTKVNEYELAGTSYTLRENDTAILETIRLVYENERLYYIPVVKNQNEGKPVRFSSKQVTKKKMVFENLQHDFPQIISYTLTSDKTLEAEISGIQNGQERKQIFYMKKKNN